MATFDLAALTSAFVGGASAFGKEVLNWDIRNLGIQVRTNVNTPQALAKFTTDGEPRPYRMADDFNGATVVDRVLTAYQSKYDMQLDAEDFRNTYLATLPEMPFEQFTVEQAVKQYLAKLMTDTLYLGVRDGAGDAAVDICDGWGTIIAAEIVGGDLVEVATGAITSANAVTKVELVADAQPVFVKQRGFRILCSYDIMEKYRIHYRTLNGFGFNKNERGQYQLDGHNGILQPAAFMGTSQRLIATIDNNLILGTDTERVSMYPTPHLNTLKNRIMFPLGCQIRDLDVLTVNDQA
jgi:hypothetical protein